MTSEYFGVLPKYVLPLQFKIRSHDDDIHNNNNNHVHFTSRPTRVSFSTDLDGNSLECPDTVVATQLDRDDRSLHCVVTCYVSCDRTQLLHKCPVQWGPLVLAV